MCVLLRVCACVCVWNINMFHGFTPFLYTHRLPHCHAPKTSAASLAHWILAWPGRRLHFFITLLLFSSSASLSLSSYLLSIFFGFVASCVFYVFVLCSWRVLIFYSAPYVTPALSSCCHTYTYTLTTYTHTYTHILRAPLCSYAVRFHFIFILLPLAYTLKWVSQIYKVTR